MILTMLVPAGEGHLFARDAFDKIIGKDSDLILPSGAVRARVIDALVCDDGCSAEITLSYLGGETNDEPEEVPPGDQEVVRPEDMDCQHYRARPDSDVDRDG